MRAGKGFNRKIFVNFVNVPTGEVMKSVIYVFLGGGAGSMLRYSVSLLMAKGIATSHFPWGTFTVNILGSVAIGLFYAWSERFQLSPEVRLLLTTGFCGGFTTFSTFSAEGLNLLRSGCYGLFLSYLFFSLFLGMAGVVAGMLLAKI